MIADQWGLTREDLDGFGAESQRRADQATAEGRFESEIIPVRCEIRDKETGEIKALGELLTRDEGIRPDTTAE